MKLLKYLALACVLASSALANAAPPVTAPPVTAPPVTAPPVTAKSTAKSTARSGPVYLVGGELHVGDGTVIKDAVVAMDGGLFTIVGGPEARAKLLDESQAIDLKGKWITPGLFAAETQLGILEIDLESSTRDDGKSTDHPVRAAHEAASALNAESALIPIQAIDGVTSAASVPTGGLISGQVAIIDLVYGDHRGLAAQPRAAISAHLGHAHAGSRAATLAKLREVLTDARGWPARRAAFDRAQSRELSAHPLDLEALQPIFKQQMVLTLSADRASDILAALDLAREFGLKIAIIGGAEAWKVADELARAKVPVIVEPTLNIPGDFDSMGARLDNAALLHKAGVTVALVAPGGTHNLRSLPQGAGIAVANGLPWEAALTAITLAPARAYGVDRTHGSITVGKVANLVVWSGDPFEFSSTATDVYVRGTKLQGTTRQNLLRDRYRDLQQVKREAK